MLFSLIFLNGVRILVVLTGFSTSFISIICCWVLVEEHLIASYLYEIVVDKRLMIRWHVLLMGVKVRWWYITRVMITPTHIIWVILPKLRHMIMLLVLLVMLLLTRGILMLFIFIFSFLWFWFFILLFFLRSHLFFIGFWFF